jgi:hypothetical protein
LDKFFNQTDKIDRMFNEILRWEWIVKAKQLLKT